MRLILNLLFSAIAVLITAYILPGVQVNSFFSALIVAVVLGLLNITLKPLLIILTIPTRNLQRRLPLKTQKQFLKEKRYWQNVQ